MDEMVDPRGARRVLGRCGLGGFRPMLRGLWGYLRWALRGNGWGRNSRPSDGRLWRRFRLWAKGFRRAHKCQASGPAVVGVGKGLGVMVGKVAVHDGVPVEAPGGAAFGVLDGKLPGCVLGVGE